MRARVRYFVIFAVIMECESYYSYLYSLENLNFRSSRSNRRASWRSFLARPGAVHWTEDVLPAYLPTDSNFQVTKAKQEYDIATRTKLFTKRFFSTLAEPDFIAAEVNSKVTLVRRQSFNFKRRDPSYKTGLVTKDTSTNLRPRFVSSKPYSFRNTDSAFDADSDENDDPKAAALRKPRQLGVRVANSPSVIDKVPGKPAALTGRLDSDPKRTELVDKILSSLIESVDSPSQLDVEDRQNPDKKKKKKKQKKKRNGKNKKMKPKTTRKGGKRKKKSGNNKPKKNKPKKRNPKKKKNNNRNMKRKNSRATRKQKTTTESFSFIDDIING